MGWIGPIAPPRLLREGAFELGDVSGVMHARAGWIAPIAAGTVPLLLALPFGSSLHQPISAIIGFVLVLAAIHRRAELRGLLTLPVVFASHCALAIFVSRAWPELAAPCFPDGPEYWRHNLSWITTGIDPEYDPAAWVPAHAQLAVVAAAGGYLTMGLIPLFQGFHEVDLMNYYVGRLLAESHDAPMSLLLGWHPWSVVRGIAFTVLVYEIMLWSYRKFAGADLRAVRWSRFGVAAALLLLDAGLKWIMLDPVRQVLAAGLKGSSGG